MIIKKLENEQKNMIKLENKPKNDKNNGDKKDDNVIK